MVLAIYPLAYEHVAELLGDALGVSDGVAVELGVGVGVAVSTIAVVRADSALEPIAFTAATVN